LLCELEAPEVHFDRRFLQMMKGMWRRRPSPALIVSIIALVLAMGGFAVAAIPDSSGVVHGCYKKKKGTLRLVTGSKCKKSERSISWNQKGQAGANGATGAKGDKGDKGDTGPGAQHALIDSAGAITSQTGGISVTTGTTGVYFVTFPESVAGKSIHVGWSRKSGSGTTGEVSGSLCGGGTEGLVCGGGQPSDTVLVNTADSSGAVVNHGFYVTVIK
jgi:hypothetical protein